MAQIYVVGEVVSDIELRSSSKNTPYIRFELIEKIGNRGNFRTQSFHVCAFADDAKRIVKSNIQKGSIIWVSGSLELELYGKRDGATADKRMKIFLDNWGTIPIQASVKKTAEQISSEKTASKEAIEIDGDKEPLPM